MATATLLTGRVRYGASKPKDYGHGERVNIVVTLESGEDVKLWGKPGSDVSELRKGATVTLLMDDKGYKLVQTPGATVPQPPQPPPATGLTPELKRAIAAYVHEQGDLMAFCWTTAQAKLGEGLSEESIRCAASSLFISAQRKFHL